jgi:hypothetical protein
MGKEKVDKCKKAEKSKYTFWKTNQPVTSKRVKVILRNSKDSDTLVKAIRVLRHIDDDNKNVVKFEVTDQTRRVLRRMEHAK